MNKQTVTVAWVGIDEDSKLYSISEHISHAKHITFNIDDATNHLTTINAANMIVVIANTAQHAEFVYLSNQIELDKSMLIIDDCSLSHREHQKSAISALVRNGFSLFSLRAFITLTLECGLTTVDVQAQAKIKTDVYSKSRHVETLLFDIFAQNNRWYGNLNLTISLNRHIMPANLRSIGFTLPDESWQKNYSFISAMVNDATIQMIFEQSECCSMLRQYLSAVCDRLGSDRSVSVNYTSKNLRDLISTIDPDTLMMSGITVSSIPSIDRHRVLIFIKPSS